MLVQCEQPETGIEPGRIPASVPAEGASVSVVEPVDPLAMPDWDNWVARMDGVTVFHTTAWLRVLRDTYGHQFMGLCLRQANRCVGLLPLAEVNSLLTGRRGVSLPFTDFCPALTKPEADPSKLWLEALRVARARGWRSLELRDPRLGLPKLQPSLQFYAHKLDLNRGAENVLSRMDGAFRRALRKAESSGLKPEISCSIHALEDYYRLHCMTRRRHGLPPQPWRFFQNIARHLLAQDFGMVVLVRKDQTPVAGAVFLHFGQCAIYKYGASDMAAQQHRPNNLVMWTAIRYYCTRAYTLLHLGRTSLGNEGLRRFKAGLGAAEEPLAVYRIQPDTGRTLALQDLTEGWHTRIFRRMPPALLRWSGAMLYPHLD
ncbi:MAG: GNAT family N-acetyltransferase [Verrucomicrobiota bacterium]|nr:GNAT family N-acetyltransferase [Limisphaera sp.]MDW8380829.1 GNAT family N-acetyltransferase [Verrucomicrobiota bacterium]